MNLRFILPISIFAVLAVISSVAMISLLNGKRDTSQLPSPLIGKQAPALVSVIYSDLSQSQTSEDLTASINKGPYLVNFFASWCAPCQKEAPFLEKLSLQLPIIGIAYKDRAEDLSLFLERFGNPFNQIGFDNDGKIAINWGVYGIPETFLISAEGVVVARHAGEISDKTIRTVLMPKLNEMLK